MKHVVNQLFSYGKNSPNQKVVEKVLKHLPENFGMVVVDIEEAEDLTKLYVEELTGSMLTHETRLQT